MSTNGFVTRLRTQFKGKSDDQAWDVHKNFAFLNKYKGGFEETGDLNRKKNKNREVSPKNFSAVNPEDTWKNKLNTSISLRTYKAEEAMREVTRESAPFMYENSTKSNQMLSKKESFCGSNELLKARGTSSIAMPSLTARTQHKMSLISNKSPSPKDNIKLYKKSLENRYFEDNSHPMKTVVAGREEAEIKNMTLSSVRIFKDQLSTKHWTSNFNKDIDAAFELKQLNKIKAPLENFYLRNDLLSKASSKSKVIT